MNATGIKIGPGGSEGLGNLKGIQRAARMKLDCMEIEFTYGVRMKMEDARQIGEYAKENGILLSVHAPYYINLAPEKEEVLLASKKRIIESCERAHALSAKNVVFHAGFYQNKSPKLTFKLIKKAILDIQRYLSHEKWSVTLCPETTGKPSQFGSLEEISRLMQETGCGITVDFAHLCAREQGKVDYGKILDKLPARFHAHFSGIEWGQKGERRHVVTTARFFEPLALELIRRNLDITLINESPQPYRDAAMMKRVLKKLR